MQISIIDTPWDKEVDLNLYHTHEKNFHQFLEDNPTAASCEIYFCVDNALYLAHLSVFDNLMVITQGEPL
jgi:hypothetical protein